MKTLCLTFLFLVFSTSLLFAQSDKTTLKLQALYANAEYGKIKKLKRKKIDQLEAKSLYYKAMAYYMTKDDENALVLMNKALNKGPVDHDMFYYKAMTLHYMEKYEEATPNFDKAIELLPTEPAFYSSNGQNYYRLNEPDSALKYYLMAEELEQSNPEIHIAIGSINSELKRFTEAMKSFQKALKLLTPNTPEHQNCSFNLALTQHLEGLLGAAEQSLKEHLSVYPNDHAAISRLIQVYYANDKIDETSELRSQLQQAYKTNSLPDHMNEMYCFDQFKWKDREVMAFRSYEDYQNEILVWGHKFFILDSLGGIDFKIQTNLDTTLATGTSKQYNINLIRNDTISIFDHYSFMEGSDYDELKTSVLDVLNEKVMPVNQMGDFERWLSKKETEKFGSQGSSFENAISVKSVSEEYAWLRRNFQGFTFIQQSLVFENNKPYDVLKIITSSGKEKSIYFDISSFYGKW